MAEVMGDNKVALDTVSASASIEAIAGVVALILAILALANVLAQLLISIAVIVLGIGVLIRGAAMATAYPDLVSAVPERGLLKGMLGLGAGVEVLTGVAGIVLGILALLGVVAELLISVAVIVLGAGLAMSSVTNLRLKDLKIIFAGVHDAVRWGVRTSSTVQIILGLAVIALGIVALFDIPTLNQVGALVLGVGTILAGTAVGGAGGVRSRSGG